MQETLLPQLAIWQNFYVIVGSAAAALTGLVFVTVTLIAGLREISKNDAFAAFSTPNVVHFCAPLLIAATLSAPWQALWYVSILLGLYGLGGIAYILVVFRRMRHQTNYKPVMEDWIWHTILPLISYSALFVTAIMLLGGPTLPLFIIGAATVLLLFIGIHNAWDSVTYITLERLPRSKPREE